MNRLAERLGRERAPDGRVGSRASGKPRRTPSSEEGTTCSSDFAATRHGGGRGRRERPGARAGPRGGVPRRERASGCRPARPPRGHRSGPRRFQRAERERPPPRRQRRRHGRRRAARRARGPGPAGRERADAQDAGHGHRRDGHDARPSERAVRRHDWGSAFFGCCRAVGLAAILRRSSSARAWRSASPRATWTTPTAPRRSASAAAIALLLVLAIAWGCGGYVPGAWPASTVARQGIGVWVWTVLGVIVMAGSPASAAASTTSSSSLNLPSMAIGDRR